MSESIPIELKRAAIALADELDHSRAAEKLNVTPAELRKRVSTLETQLCVYIFRPQQRRVELTPEGKFLIKAFRESVALHDRNFRVGNDMQQGTNNIAEAKPDQAERKPCAARTSSSISDE